MPRQGPVHHRRRTTARTSTRRSSAGRRGTRSAGSSTSWPRSRCASWPIIGWLATQSAVFFVRRGEGDRAAQRFSLEALAAGRPIGLFAEGTRSRDGHLKRLKPGAAFLAMRSGAPLLPVGIAGTHRLFPGASRWPHRDEDRDPHRRAVHAAASAGRPARSRGAGRRDRSDHASDRGAAAARRSAGSDRRRVYTYIGRHPAGTLEWSR